MTSNRTITIDGSFGEGGGSILRLSAGFSVLFNIPVKIINIRANRPKPGLKLQHLRGLQILSELTSSRLSSCKVGTTELTFFPGNTIQNYINVPLHTAASIGLLLQPIQIASLNFSPKKKIELEIDGGGTFGKWAPSLNYLREVTYKIFKNLGFILELDIKKHGFYPKGGAQVKCTITPPKSKLNPIELTELGMLDKINGEIIITHQLKRKTNDIPSRISNSIERHIKNTIDIEIDFKTSWVQSLSPGIGITLWGISDTNAIISTGTILGERKISSENLGRMAAKELLGYITRNVPVDNYLSDQLVPIMAYIQSPSKIKVKEITSHTKTNIDLVKKFVNRKFDIRRDTNGYLIQVK
jgi:RNA 3'-phosphate cyclase